MLIKGSYFDDVWTSNPVVYFDDKNVSATVVDDNTLSCIIPDGKINQNARINVRFNNGDAYFFMHIDDTLRYGKNRFAFRISVLGLN
tara:strand:- start:1360 stop:1620 length:261 start_codon:yes stop_codon:yes gene_type:complete